MLGTRFWVEGLGSQCWVLGSGFRDMVHIISPSLQKQIEELDVNLKFVVKVGVLLQQVSY